MDKEAKDRYFNELMEKAYEKLCIFASKGCNDREFAEDIVQETFLEAYRKVDILIEHPNTMRWLYTTTKYKMMKMESKKEAYCPLDEGFNNLASGEGRGDSYKEIELAETIKSAISEEEYEILRDYYVNGYSADEVAEKHGIDKGVIRMRISRLKKKLKKNVMLDWLIFLICIWGIL